MTSQVNGLLQSSEEKIETIKEILSQNYRELKQAQNEFKKTWSNYERSVVRNMSYETQLSFIQELKNSLSAHIHNIKIDIRYYEELLSNVDKWDMERIENRDGTISMAVSRIFPKVTYDDMKEWAKMEGFL